MLGKTGRTLRALVVAGALVGTAGLAQADSITGTIGPDGGCVGECLNATWTLTASDEGVGPGSYNMHVSLTAQWPDTQFIDEDGPIDPNYITAVEFGLPGDIVTSVVTSPVSGWDSQLGPVSSNGCLGKNGNFVCSEGQAAIVLGDTLLWEWDVLVPDVSAVLDPEDPLDFHIGAQLVRLGGMSLARDHEDGWLLSVNPIPEPTAALCFGFGVLVVSAALRSRPSPS